MLLLLLGMQTYKDQPCNEQHTCLNGHRSGGLLIELQPFAKEVAHGESCKVQHCYWKKKADTLSPAVIATRS